MDNYINKKNEIDKIEIKITDSWCRRGKKKYYDFIRLDLFYIIANEKVLNFLNKNNIKYWKLEKPVKVVNDDELRDEYYLIEFTDEHDVIDWKASKSFYDDKNNTSYFIETIKEKDLWDVDKFPNRYYNDKKIKNLDGIYHVKYKGRSLVVCNQKTKELLENSGLTGFEFQEQKLASEQQEEERKEAEELYQKHLKEKS